jgi:anti-sigma-K factor RskA/sigma-70-like protein
MATFDQLPAEQRAILELVVGRGQTYDELSGMLGMPTARVRELAREALGDLAPATAARVDSDWRGQIADYVLGQQSGPESTATKGHFKRSEPARAWAYSLLDSLGHLYPNGAMPEIPEADGAGPERAPVASPAPRAEPAPAARSPQPAVRSPQAARTGALSPAAQSVVRRRRIIGGILAAAVLVVVILLITNVIGGGGGKKNAASTTGTSTTGGAPTKFLRDGVLKPVNGAKGTGIAVVLQQGSQVQLVVQATKLQPTTRQTAYEVWLYNSTSDTAPLGAQFTDQQGNLQGRGAVPANWQKFRYVVLTREKVGTNPKTPSGLVLRALLGAVPTSQQQNGGGTGTTGGG